MPTFGFSAFLKMLSLSVRRQRSAMRERLMPSAGGYDFHRAFRRLAHRYLAGGEYIGQLLREAAAINNPAEARSATNALKYIEAWRVKTSGELGTLGSRIYQSPSARFKIRYEPDFTVMINGATVAVHIWNTKWPDLDVRMTYAALYLISELYNDEPGGPIDVGVLSVPDDRLFRLSDIPDQGVLSGRVVAAFEALMEEIGEEIRRPPSPPEGDRPGIQ